MQTLYEFIHELTWQDIPAGVQHQARRCLLDTLGAAIGGRQTELSRIVHEFAAAVYGGEGAQLWLDGRFVSPPGAALANGMTVDALDIHDGYNLVKGHVGAAIVPALLATANLATVEPISGIELLTTLIIGYEVAARAGLALHGTACDYHTSGAWNTLGCAAITARRLRLDWAQTGHALGIAEYHGPRSPMMRCIDHPTMLKDGSGWGAMGGVSAALLAARGFTGAPAATVTTEEVLPNWRDLGVRWIIMEQYFKPFAVCRWAQPAVTAVLSLQEQHQIAAADVTGVRVQTFHEAVRLAVRRPQSTEAAQYSLPFPVAAALVHGQLGPQELSGAALQDAQVLRIADLIELQESELYNTRFPAERLARVEVELADGTRYRIADVPPGWDADAPPTDWELRQKFRRLAGELLPDERATRLETAVWCLEDRRGVEILWNELTAPG